ncbi:MAG: hypothetical protein P4M07_28690 [Xanthobacteraceae bacterium]|nr:hypothetical protein [Xanthobacteraceae bacterium]
MTTDSARKWLIFASLFLTGAQDIFLIVSPVLGFPLEYPKNLNLLQIVSPALLGYLGAAAHFAFMTPPPKVEVNSDLLGPLVKGPVFLYALVMIATFAAFGYSNRSGAAIGTGMSVDALNMAVSISLGILAAITSIAVAGLFASDVNRLADGAQAPQHPAPENNEG